MQRPDVPAMAELEAAIEDLRETEEAIATLKARLAEITAKIAEQIEDWQAPAAATYLYWTAEEVPVAALAEAFTGQPSPAKLLRLVQTTVTDLVCERCATPIRVGSRAELRATRSQARTPKPGGSNSAILCGACRAIVAGEGTKSGEGRDAVSAARLAELRRMRYADYLQTPEWQARRQRHLRSVGNRCQVCNSRDCELQIHHRTYERRGDERYRDLIVLCRNCHDLYHDRGRLASADSPDTEQEPFSPDGPPPRDGDL